MKPTPQFVLALESHRRTLASLLGVLLFANAFVVVHDAVVDAPGRLVGGSLTSGNSGPGSTGSTVSRADGRLGKSARGPAVGTGMSPAAIVRSSPPGSVIPGLGTIPNGIHGNELTVVYYWKGDQTKSSQFLKGTGQEGNVDEGEAFTQLIAYINKHASDGKGRIMGFPFDLHGWKLKPIVLEAGKGDDQIRAAEKIASEIKPFAAVSSHGSISAYVCPLLAKAGIFNVSTYDLDWGLYEETNGLCLPAGLSWGRQVDLSQSYLKAHTRTSDGQEPVYGFLYAEYPGLVDSAPKVIERYKAAGINIAEHASVDPDLTTAGRQQATVIQKFALAGVNTIIAPDSGSLITFTHAAQAAAYSPDYFVWPCSGEDSTGMVRLYDAAQWTNASGLSCYDEHLNADLTNDDIARRSEWYQAYQEGYRVTNPGKAQAEPPAPTSLVYQSLLPLIAGITYAGPQLTVERFNTGMQVVKPFRYDAIKGVTTNPANLLVTLDAPDGSQVSDAAIVTWRADKTSPGNATPGVYVYSDRRYRRGADF
jgi:hypothetical protein